MKNGLVAPHEARISPFAQGKRTENRRGKKITHELVSSRKRTMYLWLKCHL